MIKFLVQRPIAVIMTTIALAILGLIAVFKIPVSLLPDTDIPEITVQVSYKNIEARELENSIIKGIRNQLLQVSHLRDIESETRDGNALIRLLFEYGTNINLAYIETNEKIDEIMGALPKDMERPNVIRARASDIPVFYLNIYPKTIPGNDEVSDSRFLQLSELCEMTIKKRLEQQGEIAMVDMSGYYKPRLLVKLDKDKMQSLNITTGDVKEAFRKHDIDLGSLLIKDGQYEYNIRFLSFLKQKNDVENIYIKPDNRIFQLKDFAEVSLLPQRIKGVYLYNDQPAITMGIIKKSDAQIATLKEKIQELISEFGNDYPSLNFKLSQDQSALLDISIGNLKQSLLLGGILAFMIMFFFLKDPRSPFLIGISLPISLIISFLLLYLFGISINIMSLAGLLLGMGLMIDNSIIVIDNISQHREAGVSLVEACTKGANEIIKPLLSSVLTNCAVFLPLIFLSGLAGELFYDQAVSITIGLFSSFLVAVFLLPVLYKLFHKKEKSWKALEWMVIGKWESWYMAGSNLIFKRKWLSGFLFLATIPLAFLLYDQLEKEIMPETREKAIIAKVDWNEPLHIEESQKRILEIIRQVKDQRNYVNAYIGEQQFLLEKGQRQSLTESKIFFEAENGQQLDKLKEQVLDYVRVKYPAAAITLHAPENIFTKIFDNGKAPLEANFQTTTGRQVPDLKEGMEIISKLADEGNRVNLPQVKEYFQVTVLMDELLLYKVPYERIYEQLTIALNENKVADLRGSQTQIPIVLGENDRNVYEVFNSLFVSNEEGIEIPVKNLVKVTKQYGYKSIFAGKEGEKLNIPLEATSGNYLTKENNVRESVSGFQNLSVNFSGNIYEMIKTLKELSWILILAVVLLYFILAIQFESLIQPLIILLEIPIDIFGAFLLLYLFGSSINVLSVIGIIVMSGIIINDSILKIDTINRLRAGGMPLTEAIKEGGKRRLKSILMTSITTILAMAPVLFFSGLGAELQKPLALAIIGGMIIGTIVSLYFIPLLYWAINKEK